MAALVMGMMAVACGPGATMTMTDVAAPVTLGPVQRVGGGRARQERFVGTVEGEANEFAAVSESRKKVGGGMVEVTRETIALSTNARVVSIQAARLVDGRANRDTRIDDVHTGAWAYLTVGGAGQHRWVGVKGRVVEVSHGN